MVDTALRTLFLLLFLAPSSWAGEPEDPGDEPPRVAALLAEAKALENSGNPEQLWQAATRYCEASRYGSTEAQYRLGMLYALGQGVAEHRDYAAALFSSAAHQGHAMARDMLDTVQLKTSDLPSCVTDAAALPEKPVFQAASNKTRIRLKVETLPPQKQWVVDLVRTLSGWYQIDPDLVLAIISVESDFKVAATSQKQAAGLMQIIPATSARFNVRNAYDAAQNIKGGLAYLRWLLAYYQGDLKLVSAAYNAGEGTVNRYRGVPPYPETRNYVRNVLELYESTRHPYDDRITSPSPILASKKG